MKNIFLAGMGWVPDAPAGNRLRWSYPTSALDAQGHYLGFPKTLQVFRAPVDQFHRLPEHPDGIPYPYTWWELLPDYNLNWITPVDVYQLPSPIQAVSFRYDGGPSLQVQARDSETGIVYAERTLQMGETFYLEAPSIGELVLIGVGGRLTDFHILDLFRNQPLDWKMIAEIGVADTQFATFTDSALRNDDPPKVVGPAEWADLTSAAKQAQSSTPASPDKPSAWQAYEIMLRLRWEVALLGAFAYFDGPRKQASPLDDIHDSLREPSEQCMAYRVIDPDGRAGQSNIVICPVGVALPLDPPSIPSYQDPEVRLEESDTFNATLTFYWIQSDRRAIGVEVEEEIGPSPALGTSAQYDHFEARPPRNRESNLDNSLARSFLVPFHDVHLQARACAVDAWDRTSIFSGWTPPTFLTLHHTAEPPEILSASFTSGTICLSRSPDWQPDIIVKKAAGNVVALRRIISPRVENYSASAPTLVGNGLYRSTILGVPNEYQFQAGRIVSGRFKAALDSISSGDFFFRIPEGDSSKTLFAAGMVTLQEDHKSLRLWTQVASFPAIGLPDELVFTDSPGGAGSVQYYLRVSYLGRWGRASNISTALRFEQVPMVPPPFTIQVLGRDYYERAMVRILFTSPVIDGIYTVWWADGWVPQNHFSQHAVPGEYIAQPVESNRLFDILSLPKNMNTERPITIGVQRVNTTGGQSDFQIAHVSLSEKM